MEYTIVRFKIDAVPMKARRYTAHDTSTDACKLCAASTNKDVCQAMPSCGTRSYFKKVRVDV